MNAPEELPLAEHPDVAAARRAGFDINLIECNLALTPEERALRHASALELVLLLRNAGNNIHAQPASSVAANR
jgi:hypothetical protein